MTGEGGLRGKVGGSPAAEGTGSDRVDRHAQPEWVEWLLREFARYLYFLAVLAGLVMGLLQMAASWLPYGQPAVISPALVGGMAIAFVSGIVYLGYEGYRFLWFPGGWVDRAVARRESRRTSDPKSSGGGG